jgi:hypothetical protein
MSCVFLVFCGFFLPPEGFRGGGKKLPLQTMKNIQDTKPAHKRGTAIITRVNSNGNCISIICDDEENDDFFEVPSFKDNPIPAVTNAKAGDSIRYGILRKPERTVKDEKGGVKVHPAREDYEVTKLIPAK